MSDTPAETVPSAGARANKALVLVVEDEAAMRKLLRGELVSHGYRVVEVESGAEAQRQAVAYMPDVILLDLGVEDIDGIALIKRLREWAKMPLVVVSARDEEQAKVEALDAGADDYVSKPFGIDELMARVRVALKHASRAEVHLTPIQYRLLALLMEHAGMVMTRSQLEAAAPKARARRDASPLPAHRGRHGLPNPIAVSETVSDRIRLALGEPRTYLQESRADAISAPVGSGSRPPTQRSEPSFLTAFAMHRSGLASIRSRKEAVVRSKTLDPNKATNARDHRRAREFEGGAAGAVAGAAIGAVAGPPGIVVGAVLGVAAGAVAGAALDIDDATQIQRTRELDAEIGITGGSLGAPNLAHPAATRGTYSAASAGASEASTTPAEGGMQIVEE